MPPGRAPGGFPALPRCPGVKKNHCTVRRADLLCVRPGTEQLGTWVTACSCSVWSIVKRLGSRRKKQKHDPNLAGITSYKIWSPGPPGDECQSTRNKRTSLASSRPAELLAICIGSTGHLPGNLLAVTFSFRPCRNCFFRTSRSSAF
jgi:hypothetical protein